MDANNKLEEPRTIQFDIEEAFEESRESVSVDQIDVSLPSSSNLTETTDDVRNGSDRSQSITWDDMNDGYLTPPESDTSPVTADGDRYMNSIGNHNSTGCLQSETEPFVTDIEDEKTSGRSGWSSWFRGMSDSNVGNGSSSRQLRQRSNSEPELGGWGILSLRQRRRRGRPRAHTEHTRTTAPQAIPSNDVQSSVANVNNNAAETATSTVSPVEIEVESPTNEDQVARSRWVRINRSFQNFITVVALLFSILLFLILLSWVALTSAYVISLEKSCDVPLKAFYWLVSIQLLLDVFRTDILRFMLRWNSTHQQPARVILYNVTYLIFALLVMRMGVTSVFMGEVACRQTAPDLYMASKVFVSLSLTAWVMIFAGYLLPFTIVAFLLTWNGYHPTHSNFPVFPATNVSSSDAVEHLKVVRVPEGNCCICLEDLDSNGVVVETACFHRFHRSCCREWLRQAKTCPVCREAIVEPTDDSEDNDQRRDQRDGDAGSGIPLGPSGRPVVGLVRMIRRASNRLHEHRQDAFGSSLELRQRR